MSLVVTLTFSPCIDKSYSVERLIPEIKMRSSTPLFEPGGGGINVARVLQKFGTPSFAIYPFGGLSGEYFNELVRREKVSAAPVVANHDTRQHEIITERSTGKEFRFSMPTPALSRGEWMNCLSELKKIPTFCYLVISGSIPACPPEFFWQEISMLVHSKKARMIIDSNIGPSSVIAGLGVFLVKPNLRELATLTGEKAIEVAAIEKTAKRMIRESIAEVVLVSMGADGAMLVDKNMAIRFKAPQVDKKSTVGAGDSMLAGFVHYMQCGKNIVEAASYGVACGTAATLYTGTQLCKKEDADRLLPLVVQGSLKTCGG